MKKSEVREAIGSVLKNQLEGKGFRYLKKEDGQLIRRFNGGFHAIVIIIHDYFPVYYFGAFVDIRLDAAADIYSRIYDIAPSCRADLTNASANLGYFLNGEPLREKITAPEDIARVIDLISPVLHEKVLPLLEGRVDAHRIDELVNSGDSPFVQVAERFSEGAAADSLIIARLAGNPDFERLAAEYEQRMCNHLEDLKTDFKRLVQFLRDYDIVNPTAPPAPKAVAMSAADWPVGQAVKHAEFGLGTVVKAQGRDRETLVKVDFGKAGTHKIAVGLGVYLGLGLWLEKVSN